MKILGIESSCDETAVAIVNDQKDILANNLLSQIQLHKKFGGVVPEIAARSHIEYLPNLLSDSLLQANISLNQIDAIAVTGGPGLIGGVIVGVMFAKAIASAIKKPFIAINHLEGHALTARLTNNIEFPYLLLLVSGGHSQILIVENVGKYQLLGNTLDDAIGESFDKVAKMLKLGYPGGPQVEKRAKLGDPHSFKFPQPLAHQNNCNFSFSGLKTAVRNEILKHDLIDDLLINNVCASFQFTISKILCKKIGRAIKIFQQNYSKDSPNIVLAGGVGANLFIRQSLTNFLSSIGSSLTVPPVHLCTDNAAMIAWAGIERFKQGYTSKLDFEPISRWPLTDLIHHNI